MILLMGTHDLPKSLWQLGRAFDASSLEIYKGRIPIRVVDFCNPDVIQLLITLLMNIVNFGLLNTLSIR
jgi:hypothetical protein